MSGLSENQKIGHYRVVKIIGQGGMGAVYEVRHETLERRAALKVLHPDTESTPELEARFLLEAKAASLMQHPGIVQLYEFGREEGIFFFVMEYLDGESLSARIRRAAEMPSGRLGLAALPLLQQVARALAVVHKQGFIHRDLKPGNIMIVGDPEVPGGERTKLLDFGIVKALPQADGAAVAASIAPKTRTGAFLGTPHYMAPEQWKSLPLDGKIDVYSMGCLIFQTLTGKLPFPISDPVSLAFHHVFEQPPSLAALDPSLPAELCELVARLLEKDPTSRPTMSEVADKLKNIAGTPLDTGSHQLLQPAASLSAQAQAMLDAEPRTLSAPRPAQVLAPALAASDVAAPPSTVAESGLAPPPAPPPSANVPVEIAAVPTAPLRPAAPARREVPPSEPTLPPAPRRRSTRLGLLLFLGTLSAGAGTWALMHDWDKKPAPAPRDLGPPPDLRAPGTSPDMASPPDLARPLDMAQPPSRPRSHSVRPAEGCILTAMTAQERSDLGHALRDAGVRLGLGERLVIAGLPRKPRLVEQPASLKASVIELLMDALRGLDGNFPARVEIVCR